MIRIILIIIAVLISLKSVWNLSKNASIKNLISAGFWVLASAFYIFPESAKILSNALGLGENLNTLIFLGFVILFALVFKTINMIEKTRKDIASISRKMATDEFQANLKNENQRNQKSL